MLSDTFEDTEDKICPYCKNEILNTEGIIYCDKCGIAHHTKCWKEHNGCRTKGCGNYYKRSKSNTGIDIGHKTIEELTQMIDSEKPPAICPSCEKAIEVNSNFCKHCGKNLTDEIEPDKTKEKEEKGFEEEFAQKYKENKDFRKKKFLLTGISIGILTIFLGVTIYLSFSLYINNLSSDSSKIKDIVYEWNKAFNKRDTELIKDNLDKEFIYYDKYGKELNVEKRLKILKDYFKTYKYKKSVLKDIEIKPDSTSAEYRFVTINQTFIYEHDQKEIITVFKFYKGEQSNNKWKIFREYYSNE